ncbi:MAG: anaerobic ribonucleoside-triphosphate reductase [Candidatus Diapherotrites archaeon]|nr:anaerobic ribonucleoside-triphosphate reductase [Candidatus Diapherotrites archaeon]
MATQKACPGSKFNPKTIEDKCSRAGISFWLATEVALALQPKLTDPLTEEELNDLIVQELQKRDEGMAREFENYHKVYVRTSDGVLESFNKQCIIESLLKETTLAKNTCEEIAGEVESDIRRLELRYVSAPLIREMVNSKLLERRYMQAKTEYTRLGLPIYDVTQIIQSLEATPNPEALHKKFGDAVAGEYALVRMLPDDVAKAHLTSAIHIHDLPYFATRPVSLQNDLRWFLKNGVTTDGLGENTSIAGPARHAEVAISHAIRVILSGETHLSGGLSFDFFNTLLAPYTINLSDKEVKQLVQTFLYELNQIYAVRGGSLAQSTLNFELETPPFLKKEKAILPKGVTGQDTYLDYERESVRVMNLFLNAMADGDFKGKLFPTPKVVIKVRDGGIPVSTEKALAKFVEKNDVTILNLRDREANLSMVSPNHIIRPRQGKWFSTLRTGVLQEVSINLPRIALSAKDDAEFFSEFDRALELARSVAQEKRKVIEKRLHKDKILPFLTQEFGGEEYYSLENAPSIVNIIGLDNAVHDYTGEEINKDAGALKFAERVLAYAQTKLDGFNAEGSYMLFGCLDAKKAGKRFSKMNEKRFGVKEVYPASGFTHVLQDTEKWIDTEARLQQYCRGAAKLDVTDYKDPSGKAYALMKKGMLSFTLKRKA